MADKRRVKKSIRQLQRVKTWQLLILLILMAFIAATFLRLNNIGMSQRRAAVLAADEAGETDAIQSRLYDLQRYAAEHMNAGTEAFYLEGQYKRNVQQKIEEAKRQGDSNGNVNVKAEAVCKPKFTVWSQAYVQCFTEELAKFPPSSDPAENVKLPSTSLYRYSFASPLWSPDFAGLFVLVTLAVLGIILLRLLGLLVLRLLLKRHYKGI